MDRNTIIGFVLIALILMIWMSMNAPPPAPHMTAADSAAAVQKMAADTVKPAPAVRAAAAPSDTLGKYFAQDAAGPLKTITIETKHYRATLGSRGGGIRGWELKNFMTWDQHPVNLLDRPQGSDFSLLFYSSDGKVINTKNLSFENTYPDGQTLTLGDGDSAVVVYTLPVANGSRLVKTLVFHGDTYTVDAYYRFEGMQNILSNFEYQVVWESPIRYCEHNSVDESNHAKAGAFSGGEFTEADASDFDAPMHKSISGRVSWVAMRNKYFAVAILPREKESNGAEIDGVKHHQPDKGAREEYALALKMPFTGKQLETDHFTVYMGPLDFDVIKGFNVDLDKIMSLGYAWIIRPISEYVIIPVFKVLHMVIPNYGFVLILFALLVKIVLYPLTKSSMQSMRKMQALQPMMNEIKEKYKDDPQKMNQQVMRLYKEYGVNPAGGCLPLILQMPILYALWSVFSSTIELRQAPFFWWIQDLSVPDVVMHLPFQIPLFGIDKLSGLALLMGITMVVQQKQSVQDPRQKMMVWMMPVMMTLLFNGFPAGLNLYYFMFNLLSIGQQAWMNKQHKGEPLQKVEEKKSSGGIFNAISKNMPKLKQ
jgi:YidC/Oxa1 family membrane protein insertase